MVHIIEHCSLNTSIYFLYTVYENEAIKKEIQELVLLPIKKQGNEILKWEVVAKDTTKLIKVYHSGMQLSDSLKKSIDSTLTKHKMKSYHLVSMRVNLTKEEVNELSAETAKQMFQEMHLEEIRQMDTVNKKLVDTVSYTQILKEVKIAFPFVDTMSNGWITLPNPNNNIDTLPIIFYQTRKVTSKSQNSQLYNFLRARLARDTVVLIKR